MDRAGYRAGDGESPLPHVTEQKWIVQVIEPGMEKALYLFARPISAGPKDSRGWSMKAGFSRKFKHAGIGRGKQPPGV
jgi:hypothetical protein